MTLDKSKSGGDRSGASVESSPDSSSKRWEPRPDPPAHRRDDRVRRTLGAVMLQFPLPIILLAVRQLGFGFRQFASRSGSDQFSNSCNTRKRLGARHCFRWMRSWRKSRILFSGNLSCWRLTGRTPRVAQDDGTRTRQSGRARRTRSAGFRIGRRLRSTVGIIGAVLGADSSHAAPGQD